METFLIYDIAQSTGTFTNNIIYVYIFGCVAILNYSKFSKAQKIVLIYLSTIAMRLFVPTRTIFTAVIMTITIFLVEEYLNPDQEKMRIIHSWNAKLLDFIYSFIFIDAGIWMMVLLLILSGKGMDFSERLFGPKVAPWITYIGAFILAWKIMHSIVAPKFVVKEFKDINFYFAKYIEKDLNLEDYDVHRRLELLTELEDKSYFVRRNSYNWISVEFLKYKIDTNGEKEKNRTKREILKNIFYFIKRYGIKKCVKKLRDEISFRISEISYWGKSVVRRIRGGATLEMQLIRQIAIEEGYQYVLRRKVFEFAATFTFFPQLKRYYQRYEVGKKDYFKEFLLYVYLQSVPVKVNGVRFQSIAYLMECANGGEEHRVLHIEDYNMTELYVAYLALTGAPVSDKRLVLYPDVVEEYGIDLNYAKWFSGIIAERVIRPGEQTSHCELEQRYAQYKKQLLAWPWDKFYRIGNAVLPIVENNVYYGNPDWPSYGYQECWAFAQLVYRHIWWQEFNSYAGTEDDILRDEPLGNGRRITADNARRFLSRAVPGAVVRISDTIKGDDSVGQKYHSQILLEKRDDGVVIYESTNIGTWIDFYTWEEYESKYGEYVYFKYIKYPCH